MSTLQGECEVSVMFNHDSVHQEVRNQPSKKPESEVAAGYSVAADDNAVKVERIDLCGSYDYLRYKHHDAASSASGVGAEYMLGDEPLSTTPEMQAEPAERLNPSLEEHVEVVHLVDGSEDSGWCKINVCQDGQNMDYDVSNVIMVSMDKDNNSMLLEDTNGVPSTVSTAEVKMNKESSDYHLPHNMNITTESSSVVDVKTGKGYYCFKCKKSFDMKRHFLNHLQLHFKNKDFECAECGERFYQRHCLELHRVTHLDVRKSKTVINKQLLFECKLCRTRFSSICRLENHINLLHKHTNKDASAQQNSAAISNATVQPEIGHHICYHCQNTFNDRKTFSKHIKIHSLNFECIACPKSFNSKEELKIHNWTHFSFYPCSLCDSVFKSTKELARHEEICLSHLLTNKDLVDIVGSDKLFICDVCNDVFVKKQEFQKHLHRHVKRFRCRQCGSGYHSQAALDNHEKFHEFNSHMYKCSDCPKSFYSLPLLQSHQKKHVAESKQCSICKEVFKSEEQRHKHKHLFLGNVKCDLCSIQCSGSHGLNMHKRLAHPEAQDVKPYPRTPKKNSEQIIVCIGEDME